MDSYTRFRAAANQARRTRAQADVLQLCREYEQQGCALYPADVALLLSVFGGPPSGWAWTRYEEGDGGYTNLRRIVRRMDWRQRP